MDEAMAMHVQNEMPCHGPRCQRNPVQPLPLQAPPELRMPTRDHWLIGLRIPDRFTLGDGARFSRAHNDQPIAGYPAKLERPPRG